MTARRRKQLEDFCKQIDGKCFHPNLGGKSKHTKKIHTEEGKTIIACVGEFDIHDDTDNAVFCKHCGFQFPVTFTKSSF